MKNRLTKIALIFTVLLMCVSLLASCASSPKDSGTLSESSSSSSSSSSTPSEGNSPMFADRYTRMDEDGNADSSGNYILFGNYPQTEVTDSALGGELTVKAGALPTSENAESWTSYGHYMDGSVSNFMWYIDIEHGGEMYRGVYFTRYRPLDTLCMSGINFTYQDENGYSTGNVYWFKWEPIRWRILEESGGKAFLHCEILIDGQEYYNDTSSYTVSESTVYANNYEHSNIRKWLNDTFYETAFDELQQEIILTTTVDNSAEAAGKTDNEYACADTQDKIFLLSYNEATSYYTTEAARQKRATDYARSQVVYDYLVAEGTDDCRWWLRSPNHQSGGSAIVVGGEGAADIYYCSTVIQTYIGVAPALWITL